MPEQAVVLVPRRADPERDRIWEWVRRFWALQVGLPIFEGWHCAHEGPFNRAAALNRAGEGAGNWSVAVVIDADVVLDPRMVHGSVERAVTTGGPVLGYRERMHLSKTGTEHVLRQNPAAVDLRAGTVTWRRWVRGRLRDSCSGCYVLTRAVWEAAGGWDERFVGWGWEDVAFRCATEVVGGQELFKMPGVLWHLWHTVSTGNNAAEATFVANRALGERYAERRRAWDRDGMLALLGEPEAPLEGRREPAA